MYVGLDVHKRVCHGTVMDEEGRVVRQDRFSNARARESPLNKGVSIKV